MTCAIITGTLYEMATHVERPLLIRSEMTCEPMELFGFNLGNFVVGNHAELQEQGTQSKTKQVKISISRN